MVISSGLNKKWWDNVIVFNWNYESTVYFINCFYSFIFQKPVNQLILAADETISYDSDELYSGKGWHVIVLGTYNEVYSKTL